VPVGVIKIKAQKQVINFHNRLYERWRTWHGQL